MAASDALKTRLYRLLEQASQGPERFDFGQLAEVVVQVRAGGTPCTGLNVRLWEESVMGARLGVAYAKARVTYPVLPPLAMLGKKAPQDASPYPPLRARVISPEEAFGNLLFAFADAVIRR